MCLDQFSFNDFVFGSVFLENSFIYRSTVSNDTIVVALFEFLCSKLKYNLWLIQFVKLCKCSFIVLLQSYIIHKFTEHIPQNWSSMYAYRKFFVWSNPIDVRYGTVQAFPPVSDWTFLGDRCTPENFQGEIIGQLIELFYFYKNTSTVWRKICVDQKFRFDWLNRFESHMNLAHKNGSVCRTHAYFFWNASKQNTMVSPTIGCTVSILFSSKQNMSRYSQWTGNYS